MPLQRHAVLGLFAAALVFAAGCVGPKGDTLGEKRAAAQQMRADALASLYAKAPGLRQKVAAAPGYGVFSAIGTHTIVMSTGQGYGIIRDNATGKDTYMRGVKLGAGLGAGIADVRALVVFTDAGTMHDMMDHGWTAGGKGDAAAKVGSTGNQAAMVISLPGMDVYRFTQNGLMLSGALEGAKVWKDDELNIE